MLAGVLAADPFALARGQRDLAVDRQSQLQGDARAAAADAAEKAGERLLRGLGADTDLDLDPRRFQRLDALAGGARVGILDAR